MKKVLFKKNYPTDKKGNLLDGGYKKNTTADFDNSQANELKRLGIVEFIKDDNSDLKEDISDLKKLIIILTGKVDKLSELDKPKKVDKSKK